MKYGPDHFIEELQALGSKAEKVTANDGSIFAVIPSFLIKVGQFQGRLIDLGLPATPDFPRSVGSAIHVRAKPQLYEIQNIPNVRNIAASPLGEEWHYWSHNFNWKEDRTVRRLISQINSIFLHA